MPPPLPPTTPGFHLTTPGKPIVVELYLDIICPFSCKMLLTLLGVMEQLAEKVTFVLHQVPQPWHPQGSYVHEAALAVRATSPGAYVAYVKALMEAFVEHKKFTDDDTWEKTRAQIYTELLDIAAAAGADRAAAAALLVPGEHHGTVTQSFKWAVKYHRARSVHVTPTVYVNGLEAGVVSSGWTCDQWQKFMSPMGADCFQGSLL